MAANISELESAYVRRDEEEDAEEHGDGRSRRRRGAACTAACLIIGLVVSLSRTAGDQETSTLTSVISAADVPSAACSASSACGHFNGDCCPTMEGSFLGCCSGSTERPKEPWSREMPGIGGNASGWGIAFSTQFSEAAQLQMQNAAALIEKLPYKIVRTYNLENHVIPAVLGSVQVESLIVGVTNEHVNMISSAVAVADSVVGFIISEAGEHLERVTAIAIGNEPNEPASYVPPAVVLSALANFRAALAKRPEAAHIRLTVPMTGGVITLSYPPEAAIVDPTWVDVLRDVDVVSINWFPYFVVKSEPAMPIGIALGTMPPPWHYPPDAARTSVWDPAHADPTFGLHEARSLLDIMLHASKFALSWSSARQPDGRRDGMAIGRQLGSHLAQCTHLLRKLPHRPHALAH